MAQTDADQGPTDGALMAAYASGDASAARRLTVRLAPRVLGQAMRMLGNHAEAEDVTQEAMLRLWKAAPDWQAEGAQVSTWLYRVTVNLCTDRLRKSGRGVGLDDVAEPADSAASAAQQIHQGTRAQALRQALASLPDRQAQAVALRHLEGLGNDQIARIMDTSLEAVESLTARGKRALAAALAPRRAELGVWDNDG